jgi:HK97 family phage prohead protease
MDRRQAPGAPGSKPAASRAPATPPGRRRPAGPERKDGGSPAEHLDFECELKFADGGEEAGVVEGYASKFDLLDRGGDIVKPGAFKASIADWKRKKAMPPILWQHDPYTPIGVWTELKEDDVGLLGQGPAAAGHPAGRICRSLIKAKAVRGLSIGYETIDADYDRQTGARHLKKVDLWEISPVTFPMLPEAQIAGVKGDFDPACWSGCFVTKPASPTAKRRPPSASSASTPCATQGPRARPRDGAAEMLMTLRKATQALRPDPPRRGFPHEDATPARPDGRRRHPAARPARDQGGRRSRAEEGDRRARQDHHRLPQEARPGDRRDQEGPRGRPDQDRPREDQQGDRRGHRRPPRSAPTSSRPRPTACSSAASADAQAEAKAAASFGELVGKSDFTAEQLREYKAASPPTCAATR